MLGESAHVLALMRPLAGQLKGRQNVREGLVMLAVAAHTRWREGGVRVVVGVSL